MKNTIHCLLLEDEVMSLDMMVSIIRDAFPSMQLDVCRNLQEASQVLKQQLPDLLILDINLPDGSSLDWLREIYQENSSSSILFTTAYAQHAVEAFQFSALDFLLKPFSKQELIQSIDKAIVAIEDKRYRKQLEIFFSNRQTEAVLDKKIVLKTVDELFVLSIREILAVESDNSYSTFRLKEGRRMLVSRSLRDIERQLSPLKFMRVHQSHLVNLHYVTGFKKKSNHVVVDGILEIPVSLQKKASLIEYLDSLPS